MNFPEIPKLDKNLETFFILAFALICIYTMAIAVFELGGWW